MVVVLGVLNSAVSPLVVPTIAPGTGPFQFVADAHEPEVAVGLQVPTAPARDAGSEPAR